MASLPQAAKAIEQIAARRQEEAEKLEEEKGMIQDSELEVYYTLVCGASY